jgi:3-oxoacyl-(acyl-carrier-protein) synthase
LNDHGGDDNVPTVPSPVVVDGIGVISAFGTSHETFRQSLLDGASAVRPVNGFSSAGCRTSLAAEMVGFEPTAWVPAMKLRRLDRTGVYALAAARLALGDAGISPAADGDDSLGVVMGTWTAGGQSTQQFLDGLFRGGPSGAPALLFDSTVGNSAASLVGLEYKLRGPNVTVSHKEASGLAAIVTAVDHLREQRASAILAGGVDAVYETFFKGHDRFAVMSRQGHAGPALAPFDDSRAGFVIGEGGVGLWLRAASRGQSARGHGEILGVAASSAAVAVNAWPHDPAPLVRTMAQAIADAGVTSADVSVVYASANATPILDRAEAQALSTLFGATPLVTSIKGALGESGVSGALACAAALLCGRERLVPPIAGLGRALAEAQPLRLVRSAATAPGPLTLVNSFASGGALFSCVLRGT